METHPSNPPDTSVSGPTCLLPHSSPVQEFCHSFRCLLNKFFKLRPPLFPVPSSVPSYTPTFYHKIKSVTSLILNQYRTIPLGRLSFQKLFPPSGSFILRYPPSKVFFFDRNLNYCREGDHVFFHQFLRLHLPIQLWSSNSGRTWYRSVTEMCSFYV